MEKDKIISFDNEFTSLSNKITDADERAEEVKETISDTSELIDDVFMELQSIPGALIIHEGDNQLSDKDVEPIKLIMKDLSDPDLKGDFSLSAIDTVTAIAAGVVASVIDIVFVGTPEVVKIYKGGENFDGSRLTALLRSIGNGDDKLSEMLEWLSHKCTVPYDLSLKKGAVIPNNHRLRNPGHDPMFGLLFAIADIILDTTTLIDNEGNLRIVVRDKEYPPQEKYLSVIYYLGHLLSDVCTSRGLPIPGFFMTQFFTTGDDSSSIARIAEQMYKDGYDSRHMISMSTPVVIKNLITDTYLNLVFEDESSQFDSIAEKEIRNNKRTAYKYRMRLVSDAVSCGGNAMKFFLPPTMGNMTALNLSEWASLIHDTIAESKYQLRDKSVETALFNREIISDDWKQLL